MAVKIVEITKPEELASIIFQQRKISKLSRNQLAIIAGIGRTAIFDIEHGKTTYRIDTLIKILKVLNLRLCLDGVVSGEEK
ncbi:MAG: helix-turn-helix transcriptional regulator [Ignavibacteriaceae bacterium]|nr:helix-turn-helix transcriptional regulator [Ignavibacteriaceae bacterium]